MKRLLGTLFAATLVLSACSQDDTKKDENKKSESTTEKKADDKKDKKTKEDKKSKEEKKTQENEDNNSTQEDNSTDNQKTATNEQVQSQQQTQETATQGQKQTQQAQQSDNHEPTKEEIYEWDKQNISGGTDYGLIDPKEVNKASQSSQQNDNGPSRQQYEEAQAFTKDIKENPDNYGGIGGGPALTSDAGESYDQYKQRVQEQTAPQQ